MTERRSLVPPALPTDKARLHVALWKIANAFGVTLDPEKPDHELVEQVAEVVAPALAKAFREGTDQGLVNLRTVNPYDGTPL